VDENIRTLTYYTHHKKPKHGDNLKLRVS